MDDCLPSALLPWRGRLAVLSRQLVEQGGGAGGGDDDGRSTVAAAAPTSSSTSSAPPPTPPPPFAVVVLGGCVMDVAATPSAGYSLFPGGSVPGSVTLTPGGVGRNVAVALAGLLPLPPPPRVRIVSVVGSDAAGDALVSSLERAGVDASGVGRLPSSGSEGGEGSDGAGTGAAATAATPVVVSVYDGGTGDVACSVADVAAVERALTPEIVRRELSRIERASGKDFAVVVVVDGNLSAAAVAAAAAASPSSPGIGLFEPVSVAKGVRAVRGLKCRVMTPNAAELLAMARAVEEREPGCSTSSTSTRSTSGPLLSGGEKGVDSFLGSTLAPAARTLISRGVCEFCLVTMGERGAALIGREEAMAPLREGRADASSLFTAPAAGRRRSGGSSSSGSSGGGVAELAACVISAAPVPEVGRGGAGVVSTGGAGDAFAAGFLAAACRRGGHLGGGGGGSKKTRTTISFALAAGAAAAAQVVSSPLSSPRLDVKRVWECAGELKRQARWVTL